MANPEGMNGRVGEAEKRRNGEGEKGRRGEGEIIDLISNLSN